MRRLAISIFTCLAAAPGFGQAADEPADYEPGNRVATVFARPLPRGDVSITISLEGLSTEPGLAGALRESLGCDWRPETNRSSYVSGTCRRLLKSHGGMVDDTLRLALLVAALRKAGADHVYVLVSLSAQDPRLQAPGGWKEVKGKVGAEYSYMSRADGDTPPALVIRMGRRSQLARLIPPLLLVVFVPGLLACWLRRRASAKGPEAANSGLVWLNWILLASWLYWIAAVNISDIVAFAAGLPIDSLFVTLLVGAALFSLPPLVTIAACLAALAPPAAPDEDSSLVLARLVKRGVAGEAAAIVPLGIFLVGSEMFLYDWRVGLGSLLAAYLAYKGIGWLAWRWTFGEMRALDGGELVKRAGQLARKAGVGLKKVYLLRNRLRREANAFALPGQQVMITESLLRYLSKREIDAVMAHEVGHIGGWHIGSRMLLFWVYFLVAGPAVVYLVGKGVLPQWFFTLPVLPLFAVFAMARLSQRHEYSADARAAELTGDPEATIAALSRLASLTNSPVHWGGVQGSILSHPSMRNRVLSVARRYRVPEERALALLDNPDLLGGESYDLLRFGVAMEGATTQTPAQPDRYSLPAELTHGDPVFSAAARISFLMRGIWLVETTILGLLFGLAYLLNFWPSLSRDVILFLLALPVVFWLHLRVDRWWRRRFQIAMKRKIDERLRPPAGGLFAGLRPGDRIETSEGFYEWDLGYLFLSVDRLTFIGERTQFSLARTAVTSIETKKGPISWARGHRVVLRWEGGVCSVQRVIPRQSWREAHKLQVRLDAWRQGTPARGDTIDAAPVLPPPLLPVLRAETPSRVRSVWYLAKKMVKLFLVGLILNALLPYNPLNALVVVAAPVLFFVAGAPLLLRPRQKVAESREDAESVSVGQLREERVGTEASGAAGPLG